MRPSVLTVACIGDGLELKMFNELGFVNGISSSVDSSLSATLRLRYMSFVSTLVMWSYHYSFVSSPCYVVASFSVFASELVSFCIDRCSGGSE